MQLQFKISRQEKVVANEKLQDSTAPALWSRVQENKLSCDHAS